MALAGSMAGGIAGFLGNPAELVMVRMQADKAKPVESESKSQARPVGGYLPTSTSVPLPSSTTHLLPRFARGS
jgi:dicarboxylate transporter 10